MKLGLLTIASAAVLTVGCSAGPTSAPGDATSSTQSQRAAPQPAHIAYKPGSYVVGTDIAAGSWDAEAPSITCNYATVRNVDKHQRRVGKFVPRSPSPTYGDDGIEIGQGLSFRLWDGDVLELMADKLMPELNGCLFWNTGDLEGTSPVPEGSKAPWDVDRAKGIPGSSDWSMGQFDYLDSVKVRIPDRDEMQLTAMGMWTCKINNRVSAADTLRHFARLTEIQADYLVTTAYKYMCPENIS